MIDIIAWCVFSILTVIATVHFLWATGSTWPVSTPEQFIHSFIGMESLKDMPNKSLTAVIATLILIAAMFALWGAEVLSLPLMDATKPIFLWVLFTIFLVRGLSTYLLPNLPRTQPFKSLDRLYFAPLCLLLASGYLTIALNL